MEDLAFSSKEREIVYEGGIPLLPQYFYGGLYKFNNITFQGSNTQLPTKKTKQSYRSKEEEEKPWVCIK